MVLPGYGAMDDVGVVDVVVDGTVEVVVDVVDVVVVASTTACPKVEIAETMKVLRVR